MPDPINSAWAYPLLGLLHLLTHPSTLTTPFQTLPTSYLKSTTLFRTLLKTFILTTTLTTLLILTLFKITNHLLVLIARNFSPLSILAQSAWLRGVVALLGVAVQGALIAGVVVEYGVGEGAKRVGGVVLAEKMRGMGTLAAGTEEGLTGGVKDGVTFIGGSVDYVVQRSSQTTKSSLWRGVLHEKGVLWAVKKIVSIPATAIPVVGPAIYAAVNSGGLGWAYVGEYARSVGVEKEIQENQGSVKAFGLIAGILHALPIVGPVFYFSNFVGSALWIADLKEYKMKKKKK